MRPSSPLPIEIVERIIKYFCDEIPNGSIIRTNSGATEFPDHVLKINLLHLRLVARSWARAIPKFVYSCLTLKTPWVNGFIIKMWRNCVVLSDISYIRHLCLDQVMFFPPAKLEALNKHYGCGIYARLDYDYQHKESGSIFMEHAADIVLLCGSKLAELKLKFTYSVGFSDDMITAICHLKSLKKLFIEGTHYNSVMNDSQSIAAALSCVPSLESLTFNFATLDSMDLEPGALPNLFHFWISSHPSNLSAVRNFVRTEGKGIKILEYMPMYLGFDSAGIFLSLSQSLESVFINGVPDDIKEEMRSVQFPNLRIVRCRCTNPLYYRPSWLQWAMFEKVEVLILNYWDNRNYWQDLLWGMGDTKLIMPPTLKHFIFITGNIQVKAEKCLVNGFRRQGVRCHFRTKLSHTEIMEMITNLKNGKNV